MSSMTADLHVHTTASDGVLSPKEIVARAHGAGLSCIAVTDHDGVGGIEEAVAAGAELGMKIIPGIEISTISEADNEEIHMLGYFIRWRNKSLQNWLDGIISDRKERAAKMVENLRGLGYDIELSRVEKISGSEFIGRPHIARAILEKRYASGIGEVFSDKFIGKESKAYVERRKVTPQEGIDIIRKYGGVAAIGHPGGMPSGGQLEDGNITTLVDGGLSAIEVDCPKHSPEQVELYRRIAKEHGLIATAGSDYHGHKGSRMRLGACRVDMTAVEALADLASKNA